jgi:hypothetical protein
VRIMKDSIHKHGPAANSLLYKELDPPPPPISGGTGRRVTFIAAGLILLCSGGFFSCFNTAAPDSQTGGISIRLPEPPGGLEPGGRALVNDVEAATLYYHFIFTGPGGQVQTRTVRPWEERSFTVTTTPGNWNIQAGAYTGGAYALRGLGAADVTVPAGGLAAAQIQMSPVTVVSDAAAFYAAISGSADGEVIVVNSDLVLDTALTINNKKITIAADGGNTQTLTCTATPKPENWFTLSGTGSLTLGASKRFGEILDGTLSLNGSGSTPNRFIRVNSGGTFTLRDGAKLVDNNYSVSVDANGMTVAGGAIYVADGGTLHIEGGEISGNRTYGDTTSGGIFSSGGGVYVTGTDAVFRMTGGTISGNTARATGSGGNDDTARGGGVYVAGGSFTMSGGTISDNVSTGYPPARSYGGGVYITGADFTMSGGTISGNSGHEGGGIWTNALIQLTGGTISDNTVSGPGGGVFLYSTSGRLNMSRGTISGNTASTGGGAYMSSANFTMSGGTISGNTASTGGGIWANDVIQLSGGTISGNIATTGAGVYASGISTFFMRGSILIDAGNEAKLAGGRFITLYGNLTKNPAANINPTNTASGTKVLGEYTTSPYVGNWLADNYMKFQINGESGKIGPDGKIL